MLSRHITFQIEPLAIPSLAIAIANERSLVEQYAMRYDPDNGDSVTEYCDRVAFEVYPSRLNARGAARADLKALLRAEIKRRNLKR